MASRSTGARGRIARFIAILVMLLVSSISITSAQEAPPAPNEQFIPADQLDTVFERDRRGVMMKRDEFRKLLETARANAAAAKFPVPILAERAALTVTQAEQQAIVRIELSVRQFADGWQMLRIPAGNLLIESVEIDGAPALISRDPADPTALLLAHETVGAFSVVLSASTPLVTVGSDRTAAFQLPQIAATSMTVNCPAGRHLLVNDLKLDRPAADDAVTDYVIPVGSAADVRLRWVVQREESESQTLVFVHTDARLQVQKGTTRWDSDSRISVFGGTINRVIATVPSRLEITAVESAGLESWTLDDDPANAEQTRVTLTYRQPFTNDRLVKIRGVSVSSEETLQRIPTLQFADVTSHAGRLVVTHEDGLRLMSETGGGVRRISAAELGLSGDASVFDFWQQAFDLKVAAKPRDRELFTESSASLSIDDTTVTFDAALTIETLNAPLFELAVTLPADWQLQTVLSGGQPIPWTAGSDPTAIIVRPAQPIAAGQLLSLTLKLTRTIADPDLEQRLPLPIVTANDTTTVGGSYVIRFADDLIVSPVTLTGLNPVSGSGTELIFQNLGTTVSGELAIARKPSRLAGRSVLRSWADSRQQSLDAEIIADVLSGTIRSLTVRLSESLGPDVRFSISSVGAVPGLVPTRAIQPVTIIEQSAGTPANGLRPFVLKLDHRFAGSLSLHAFVQQARTDAAPIAAPIVQIQDAVRQHGVLVFEAAPEQQLTVGPEVAQIPGLFVADAGLVDAPPVATGRRVALTYRFVQPDYAFSVVETRFETNAVPSAVCELLANICTLNDAGGVQRWTQAKVRSSGVQTLRFTLPDADRSFLWSTMLNGEPVEVRRDGDDYLVAVPADADNGEFLLTVLFETADDRTSAFGQTNQRPLQLAIDAGDQHAIPIDVLKQVWRVHYPQTSLLVDSAGQFRPDQGVDQPGWLVTLGRIAWPDRSRLAGRLIPMTIFFLVLFVLTVMVQRRRWKSMIALTGVVVFGFFLLLPATQQARERAGISVTGGTHVFFNTEGSTPPAPTSSVASTPMSPMSGAVPPPGPGGMGGMPGGPAVVLDRMTELSDESVRYVVPGAAPPGMAGGLGGGGFGGGGGTIDGFAAGTGGSAGLFDQAHVDNAPRDDFNQAIAGLPVQPPTAADPFDTGGEGAAASAAPQVSSGERRNRQLSTIVPRESGSQAVPQRGSARLSVNVNLDVPAGYQAREFTSVADAVHQPSVLSLVVQKRSQISAIRLVAALLVILIGWKIRTAPLLWKLTVAIIAALVAIAALPLVENAWQSVLDGIVLGSCISAVIAIIPSLFACCRSDINPLRLLNSSTAKQSTAALLLVAVVSVSSAQTSVTTNGIDLGCNAPGVRQNGTGSSVSLRMGHSMPDRTDVPVPFCRVCMSQMGQAPIRKPVIPDADYALIGAGPICDTSIPSPSHGEWSIGRMRGLCMEWAETWRR